MKLGIEITRREFNKEYWLYKEISQQYSTNYIYSNFNECGLLNLMLVRKR
jgi:hypothetical protein